MSYEDPTLDPELTEEQLRFVAQMSKDQIDEIDTAIMSATGSQYRKVAMIVGSVMLGLKNRIVGVPDVFYSQRVAQLVEEGKLVAKGSLKRMRFSEVKLP